MPRPVTAAEGKEAAAGRRHMYRGTAAAAGACVWAGDEGLPAGWRGFCPRLGAILFLAGCSVLCTGSCSVYVGEILIRSGHSKAQECRPGRSAVSGSAGLCWQGERYKA